LEPAKFPKTYESRSYWLHLPACLHYFWDRFITGRDVPVDLSRDSEVWKSFPLPENLDETRKASADLLAEASTGKVASIPPGAIVQIPFGPFAYCEVHEVKSDVFFVFRTPERRFAVLWIGAYHDVFYFPQIHSADPEQFNLEGIYASAKLVMAAIIRDFWVVEEREIVFAAREAREHEFRFRHDKQQEPRVVYLPRIKYVQKPNVAACAKELNHPQRREHFVRPFLRRAGHASEDQRFLAAEYGFSVPTGFTFVRPHKRGGQPRDIVYRSRSALRSLYEAHDAGGTSTGPVRWFQFERDVSVLLKSIGFDVEHVGASRNGDHGIDVLATKGDDLEKVTWLIQCKCYHPTREVDPDKVRSLLGALQDAPPNCRGMLVTTSYFGPEARRLADSHGIRLMDGEEFSRRVLGSRPKRPS
jgi:hypothetical protein